MNMITNHLPTAELQALDAAHHMHPFTDSNGQDVMLSQYFEEAKKLLHSK